MKYGDKRDYRKIDIFVNGRYEGSTTWAKSLKQAKEKYIEREGLEMYVVPVVAKFSN